MDDMKLYDEIERFYNIRQDDYARKYVEDFVKCASRDGVKLREYLKYFNEEYKNKTQLENEKSKYEQVLKQFIKYVCLDAEVHSFKHHRRFGKSKMKIHKSFHDLQKTSSKRLD